MSAAQQAIAMHQEELLRTAQLLTGEAGRAARLAERACLESLQPLLRADEGDARGLLLRALAAAYLQRELELPPTPSGDAETVRFQVANERGRLWEALDRCDPPQRLALVLRDFNGLDEEAVAGIVHWNPHELRERLHAARQRLLDAAGAGLEQSTTVLLLTLSLGVPRVDLWDALAEPERRLAAQERRRRGLLTLGAAAVVAALLLGGALWLGGDLFGNDDGDSAQAAEVGQTSTAPPVATARSLPTAYPTMTPALPERPPADVPDSYIVTYLTPSGDPDFPDETTFYVDPATGRSTPLAGIDQLQMLTAEGRVAVFTRLEGERDNWQNILVALDTTTGEVLWERETPYFAGRAAIVGEHLYAIHYGSTSDSPPTMASYRLADGEPGNAIELSTGNLIEQWAAIGGIHLFASPDGERLRVAFVQSSRFSAPSDRRIVLHYSVPELERELVASESLQNNSFEPADFGVDFYSARMAPDGKAIYGLDYELTRPAVKFFDLETAAISRVELPLAAQPASLANNNVPMSPVLSHDGRWLYVIGSAGEVAVVDLVEQRVVRHFPLDTNGYLPPAGGDHGWNWHWGAGILSLDGQRIYLVHSWVRERIGQVEDWHSLAWMIDLARWEVIATWELPGDARPVALTHDGTQLLVSAYQPQSDNQSSQRELYAVDTATGERLAAAPNFGIPVDATGFSLYSLRDAYNVYYGYTPAMVGVAPTDLDDEVTLPLMNLVVAESVVAAGGQAAFEVRFVHPVAGAPLSAATVGVRYDAGASVTLTLSHDDTADLIVVPLEVGEGVFEAVLPLDTFGEWDITATAIYPDGTRWSREWRRAIEVTPSFLGDDGRSYVFQLSADPTEPLVNRDAVVRAMLVDGEHGGHLPAEVEIEGGLPETVDVNFLDTERSSFKRVTLDQAGHDVYEGIERFLWSGRWQASFEFRVPSPDGAHYSVAAGELVVRNALIP